MIHGPRGVKHRAVTTFTQEQTLAAGHFLHRVPVPGMETHTPALFLDLSGMLLFSW